MKILCTAPFDQKYLDRIPHEIGNLVIGPPEISGLLSSKQLHDLVATENPEVLIVELNQVTSKIIRSAPKLEIIVVCRGGTSNIDVVEASNENVLVLNTPGRNAIAVAEWAIAHMLNLARNFHTGIDIIKSKQWVNMLNTFNQLEGYELSGSSLGLVGFGSIGKEIVKRLASWDMDFFVFDPYIPEVVVNNWPIKRVSLNELFSLSDYLVVAASATQETKGMINKKCLDKMMSTSYFINIARSNIVDNQALFELLKEKKIAGAALDVFDEEPLAHDSPWFELDNVVLTPHLGGATKDVIRRHSKMVFEDLLAWKNGLRPKNLVNSDILARRKLQ